MESAKQKNRRGFTLAELLVAITVGLIVIAALLSLVVMMNSYLVKRTATSKLSSELYHVKNEISDWFYQYDTEKYRIYVNHEYESEVLALSRPDTEPLEIVTLRFDEGEKRFDGDDISDSLTYTLIQNVRFNCDEDIPDLVKCTVVYMADGKTGEYVFALVKKSG